MINQVRTTAWKNLTDKQKRAVNAAQRNYVGKIKPITKAVGTKKSYHRKSKFQQAS